MVSTSELGEAMWSIGLNPDEEKLKKIIKSVDADRNDMLNFKEFQALMINKVAKPIIDILRKFFDDYDLDNDGYITIDEARLGFSSGGLSDEAVEKSIRKMFNEQDVDKDGKINFEGEDNNIRVTWNNNQLLTCFSPLYAQSFLSITYSHPFESTLNYQTTSLFC